MARAKRARTKKVPADKLSAEIRNILAEYGDEVTDNLSDVIKRTTVSGAKALRAESKRVFPNGKGYYAAGWRSRLDTKKRTAQGIIYNAVFPGLPHLLEHGHLNRDGTRTPGRVHIKTIESRIIRELDKEVQKLV